MIELIRGDEIRAVKRVKGHVWWCPWCDTSHQDSQRDCTKCGAVRYEAAPVAVLGAVVVPQGGTPSLAPEPPPTIPTVETKAPVSRPDRDKAKKPKHGGRR